jgi:membrane-associated phospholipid phosphatase
MNGVDTPVLSDPFRGWVSWWNGLSLKGKYLPLLAIAAYWAVLAKLGGFRGDHVTTGVIILGLYYGGRLTHPLLPFVMPFLLTAICYDSQRFYSDYIRGPIHVSQPYNFDKAWFGIMGADGVLRTPNEWWQLHSHPALDLITGFAYLTFFMAYIAVAAYFYFWVSRKGTETLLPGQVRERSRRMGWAFYWLNIVGYSTYYWYAASPPWYVALYGLGPARTDVPPSAASCVRFDEILGTHFFTQLYGRSADVHGAIPSLHVSYPLLAFIFALQFKRLRVFSLCFYLLMCFSAVYLNHHYILDILWGSAYAIIMYYVVDVASDWAQRRRAARAGAKA